MTILVTGGAGYIGSHTLITLLQGGHKVVVIDNLTNSSEEALRRVEEITRSVIPFYKADVRDKEALTRVFTEYNIDGVIHFAGLKAVGESTEKPLMYYENNLGSTFVLLEVMKQFNVRKLVFSSSATVYGSAIIPYSEESPTGQGITNPYGQTKYMIEQILKDMAAAQPDMEITLLRYFNPVGAHESGLIGEDPKDIPNNLMPFITQVATGRRNKLSVFGDDYDTVDGTGVRDYIHVMDLAKGHLIALEKSQPGAKAYNLGSGVGTSVLQLVHAFEKASGQTIRYEIVARRAGDLPEYYAKVDLASDELGWQTEKTIDDCCADSWRWQSQNPNGYTS